MDQQLILAKKCRLKHFQLFYARLKQNVINLYKIMLKSHTQSIALIFNCTENFI